MRNKRSGQLRSAAFAHGLVFNFVVFHYMTDKPAICMLFVAIIMPFFEFLFFFWLKEASQSFFSFRNQQHTTYNIYIPNDVRILAVQRPWLDVLDLPFGNVNSKPQTLVRTLLVLTPTIPRQIVASASRFDDILKFLLTNTMSIGTSFCFYHELFQGCLGCGTHEIKCHT